jgi:ABC-2 type transport system ATP-binding protein
MEQVEQICEDIVLINKGKVILNGNVSQIKNDFKEFKFSLQFAGQLPDNIPGLNSDQLIHKSENEIVFKVTDYHNSNHILQSLISNGVSVKGFNEILPSLNEIFIQKVTQ